MSPRLKSVLFSGYMSEVQIDRERPLSKNENNENKDEDV